MASDSPQVAQEGRFGAQEPSSATFAWLNDDLLAKCFGPLSQEDRVALVCRGWHAASTMLQEVVFGDKDVPTATLPAARLLLPWLQRYGRAVRSLSISLMRLNANREAEMRSLLDCWLVQCSSGLERVTMSLRNRPYTLRGWALAAPRLRKIKIRSSCTLQFHVTLIGMTALRRLEVDSMEWHLGSAVWLPQFLTCLSVSNHSVQEMPSQVAALTNLRSLVLREVQYSAASMASLSALTSLQHAAFAGCKVPDSLPELRGLLMLQIINPQREPAAMAASLDSALRQLTQLTGLWLEGRPTVMSAPASLAALSRLQWLCIHPWRSAPGVVELVLPLGPWQRSLRHVATTFPVALGSLPFLSGAGQLQRLSLREIPAMQSEEDEQWQVFRHWAAQHAPLQRIEAEDCSEGWIAMQQLQAQRPALHIDRTSYWQRHKELLAGWN